MTTYNTGNPVGSADPRDLYDNAQVIDDYANGDADTTQDRLGVTRKTLAGMENEFDQDQSDRASEYAADKTARDTTFDADQADREQRWNLLLANSGYDYLADYAAGIEVTEYNQVIRDTAGELWRATTTTTLPYTTTGTGLPEGGAFIAVGDADIRNDLAAGVSAGKGGLLVRGSVIYVDTIADLQALNTSWLVYGQSVRITTTGRAGVFRFSAVDRSVDVSSDPYDPVSGVGGGIYVAPDSDATGASGAWVRQFGQSATSTPQARPGWWGAKLDGESDDSAAIKAAIRALVDLTEGPPDGGTTVAVAGATLDFGQSKCFLSEAVGPEGAGSKRINLVGNKAVMIGAGTNDCFYYDGTYRVSVSGFEFQNFRDCISFDTNNIAGATFTVTDCAAHTADCFVTSRGYADSRSTVLNISRCFTGRDCKKAVKSTCDVTNIAWSNFQHGNAGQSLFEIDSRATVFGCMMTPYVTGAGTRWFDFYDDNAAARWLAIENTRIGGEFGGITAVYNYAQGRSGSQVGNGITIRSSLASCGAGGPLDNGSIVVLASNGASSIAPNRIVLDDVNSSVEIGGKVVITENGEPISAATQLGFSVQIDEPTRKNVLDKSRFLDELVKPFLNVQSRIGYQNIIQTGDISIDATLGDVVNVQASSLTTVTSINFPVHGMRVTICNQSSLTNVVVQDDSTAGNGIHVGGSDLTLPAFSAVTLIYTEINNRWLRAQ